MNNIKFVDLRNSGLDPDKQFAFLNKLTDQFVTFTIRPKANISIKRSCFADWDDLLDCVRDSDDMDKFRSLCPGWVFEISE